MTFTLKDASEVVAATHRDPSTGESGYVTPLAASEGRLLQAMIAALAAHNAALLVEDVSSNGKNEIASVREPASQLLAALEATNINIAVLDPILDQSYTNPDSNVDLAGLLGRLISGLAKLEAELPEKTGTRVMRSHPGRIKSSGLAAAVDVLRNFWEQETGLPFTERIDERVESDGEKFAATPALRFVHAVAQKIDAWYTLDQCSQAMRPR
ncbi:hypothetical protein RFN29_23925 [Mesorhizobium sp. VK22B]|uniref:Uncharacterized protein n=1 Tax=Mesorhizobium captivum TaxID=3072319 RepID=A0ABU4Z5W9_9HYPH|nr:hypothetical protein [Mesorhizobium sp. VK22B]MDX8494624.1 hypothetical protein [Mesorhizobium sp. VK22B]